MNILPKGQSWVQQVFDRPEGLDSGFFLPCFHELHLETQEVFHLLVFMIILKRAVIMYLP